MTNNTILNKLITPVKKDLGSATFFKEESDSLWETYDYWKEGEIDGVKAIIYYTVTDKSKVVESIELMLSEDQQTFCHHEEVSSLLAYVAFNFPNDCLKLLNEIVEYYKPEMNVFDPYGDVIYRFLFEKVKKGNVSEVENNLVKVLNKKKFGTLNWAPIFKELIKNGNPKNIKAVLYENENEFKKVDLYGYFSVVLQAKAIVYGMKSFPEIQGIIKENLNSPDKSNRIYYSLLAIQEIIKNHIIDETDSSLLKAEIKQNGIPEEYLELVADIYENISASKKIT